MKEKIRKTFDNRTLQSKLNQILNEDDNPDEVMQATNDTGNPDEVMEKAGNEEVKNDDDISEELKNNLSTAINKLTDLKTKCDQVDLLDTFDNILTLLNKTQTSIIEYIKAKSI